MPTVVADEKKAAATSGEGSAERRRREKISRDELGGAVRSKQII